MNDNPALVAARQRRDEILATERWIDDATVLPEGVRLIKVWHDGSYRFPTFQVDRSGQALPRLNELIAVLPDDRSGWHQLFWLCQPHGRLSGRTPIEVFATDPQAVIVAAKSTFEPDDTNW